MVPQCALTRLRLDGRGAERPGMAEQILWGRTGIWLAVSVQQTKAPLVLHSSGTQLGRTGSAAFGLRQRNRRLVSGTAIAQRDGSQCNSFS